MDKLFRVREAIQQTVGAVKLFATGDFNADIAKQLGVDEDSPGRQDLHRPRDGVRVG